MVWLEPQQEAVLLSSVCQPAVLTSWYVWMPGVNGSPSVDGAFMTSNVRSMTQVPPTREVGSLALRVIAGPTSLTSPVAGEVCEMV